MNHRKFLLIVGVAAALVGCVTFLASAQTSTSVPRYEVAMIKWDGPDKVQLIMPEKNEFIRVFKSGTRLPPDIHDEEYCLTWAANKLAKEGWEPVNLNSTRILMRRAIRGS